MEVYGLQKKIDSLLEDLRALFEASNLSEMDVCAIKTEIDRILYECLYYKAKIIS